MGEVDLVLRRKDKPGSRGYQYEVWMGEELLCSSRDPEFTACRRLVERGICGIVRFFRTQGAEPSIIIDIEKGAKLSVSESDRGGVRIVKYNDYWSQQEDEAAEEEQAIAA